MPGYNDDSNWDHLIQRHLPQYAWFWSKRREVYSPGYAWIRSLWLPLWLCFTLPTVIVTSTERYSIELHPHHYPHRKPASRDQEQILKSKNRRPQLPALSMSEFTCKSKPSPSFSAGALTRAHCTRESVHKAPILGLRDLRCFGRCTTGVDMGLQRQNQENLTRANSGVRTNGHAMQVEARITTIVA